MATRLRIDLDRCIKAGECYYNHPNLFKVGKDGFPTVLIEDVTDEALKTSAEAAVDACPSQAIRLDED